MGRKGLQYIESPTMQVSTLVIESLGMSLCKSLEEFLPISRRSVTKLWVSGWESYSARDKALD
jgi:hypothetical protein